MPFVPLNQIEEPQRGFIPLGDARLKSVDSAAPIDAEPQQRGFIPLDAMPKKSGFIPLESVDTTRSFAETVAPAVKTMQDIGKVYPVAETAANLITQGFALPVAGVAGLGAMATNALGLTDTAPADVVHSVSNALTFQPISDAGKHLTQTVMLPFEKLAEAGQWAGGKTLDATGSPVAATAVDTAINALPMAISPVKKGAMAVKERIAGKIDAELVTTSPAGPVAMAPEVQRGFTPLQEAGNAIAHENISSGVRRLEADAEMVLRPGGQGVEMVRGNGDSRLPGVAPELSDVSNGRGAEASTQPLDMVGPEGHQRQLRTGERGLGSTPAADQPPTLLSPDAVRGARFDDSGSGAGNRLATDDLAPATSGAADFNRSGHNAGSIAVPQKLSLRELQRSDVERSGMGETLGPETANATRASTAGDVAGTGIATGKVEPMAQGFHPLNESSPEVRNSFAPGANYAPLVDDSRAATDTQSVADLPAPIRREGIIKDLTKALDTVVYEGRVKGKNRLGFFRPKLEEVRTKRANDLEVAAHELAHLVDDRIPEIRKAWQNDKALAAELKSISYDQTKVYEGFAEGVRLWMTQPETLQAKAPKVAAWLDDFAGQHPYGPALKKAQADMSAWFSQDALNRARSKIGTDKQFSEHFDRAFDKFRQSTVDDLHGIYQMERQLNGGKVAPVGAYETARLSRASASIADGAVRFGYPVKKADGSFTYAGKGLMEALKPVAEGMDDALLYFVGRSARELMQQGREHLFTQGEIQGMLKLRTPERDAAFKDYQAWNKGVLDFAEAQGVINPEARALWQRTQYLPFHRVTQPGTLKGKPGDWAGIKALTGGTENIKDVLGNMVANAAMLIDTAVKNEARLKVAELASKPGAGKFMVKIDPESRPVKVSGSQVMDAMFEKYGIAVDGNDLPVYFRAS